MKLYFFAFSSLISQLWLVNLWFLLPVKTSGLCPLLLAISLPCWGLQSWTMNWQLGFVSLGTKKSREIFKSARQPCYHLSVGQKSLIIGKFYRLQIMNLSDLDESNNETIWFRESHKNLDKLLFTPKRSSTDLISQLNLDRELCWDGWILGW